jgi:subtilisin family serine protease
LDIVAPGTYIYTTAAGITGNYDPFFSGTSAAAPHVTDVAALILSANPNLTQQQVVNRIERSAKKVGGYSYATTSGRPNEMWNNQMGYGLIDAHAALTSAPIISHELIPHSDSNRSTVVFSVDNPESGVTYQWKVNGSIYTN